MMTKYLVQQFEDSIWLADSQYNKETLCHFGLKWQKVAVVPPFNKIEPEEKLIFYRKSKVKKIMFVGRFVPNKGQRHLIEILRQYIKFFSSNIEFIFVGSVEPPLKTYFNELIQKIDQYNLEKNIRIFTDLPSSLLSKLYKEVHMFLCMSEHEGFCVPLIEAQHFEIPVLAGNRTAIRETLGAQQLLVDFPQSEEELVYIANLMHQTLCNADLYNYLVKQGKENVSERFYNDKIEKTFVQSINPVIAEYI
jgi:glycosyltransferase involved in cell wall biosynthesis